MFSVEWTGQENRSATKFVTFEDHMAVTIYHVNFYYVTWCCILEDNYVKLAKTVSEYPVDCHFGQYTVKLI